MATVASIVSRSLRLIGVLDAAETPAAIDMQTGIEVLNARCVRIEADGIAMGWAPVALPSDNFPAPVEAEEPIAYLLAVRLAHDFRATINPEIAAGALVGLGKLQADMASRDAARVEYDLPASGAYGGHYPGISGFLSGR